MCRIAAYLGDSLPISSVLYDPPHSLEHQAYLPREMLSGHVNVDGTGVAWWKAGDANPLLYVSELPPWSDPNLSRLAPKLEGSPILSVVRSATPGMPSGVAAAHPFTYEGWAGGHNGYITGFDDLRWKLLAAIDEDVLPALEALTDSVLLFFLAMSFVRRGASLAEAGHETVRTAARLAADAGEQASLNLVLAGEGEVVGLRAASGLEPNSLYHLASGRRWPAGRLIASEPLDDDPGWTAVPPEHMVRITATGVAIASFAG